MDLVLHVLFGFAALAVLLVGLVGSQLRRSDAAGNGLAEVWMLGTLALAWLLVAVVAVVVLGRDPRAPEPAGIGWSTLTIVVAVALPVAIGCQLRALGPVFAARERGWYRRLLLVGFVAVPTAFLLHLAQRGLGLPLPTAWATTGCGAVGLGFSLLPWARASRRSRRRGTAA